MAEPVYLAPLIKQVSDWLGRNACKDGGIMFYYASNSTYCTNHPDVLVFVEVG